MTEQYIQELIFKYSEGTASAEEVQKLMDWYRSSHVGEVQWPSLPSEKGAVSQRMLARLKEQIAPKPTRVIHFSWQKIAAIFFVFIGVAAILVFSLRPSKTSFITVANPSGKVQLVTLPDNSKVWLNASTIIRYPQSFKKERQINLEGEAYFEVTHDSDHPFVVEAGNLETTVLGTSFNVKAYKSGIATNVSVISGRVKVTNNSKELAVLSPSDQLKFDRLKGTQTVAPIDTNNVLAWKNGKLKFDDESFAEMAVVLESWYDIKIKFAESSVAACRFYMSVENTIPIEQLLSLMSDIAEIEYVFNKEKTIVTIYGQGCL